MLRVTNLEKNYQRAGGGTLRILKGVSFEIQKGDLAFLIGRSGAGKSTLLHLLGGLDRPNGGQIEFEGKKLAQLSERSLAEYRNQKVGFIFQFYHLLPELTVKENVELPALIGGNHRSKRSEQLLKRVGLWNRKDHLPNELSGGEQQRVAIARALMNEPDLVLGDEPTGNLDEETAETIHQLIFELNREGQTFCVVTHEESFAQKGNRIFRLHDGLLEPIKN